MAKIININKGKLLLEKKSSQEVLWQQFLEEFDSMAQKAQGNVLALKEILLQKYKIRKL